MITTDRGVVALVGSVILLAACETTPHTFYASQNRCVASQPDPEVAKDCFAKPEARAYLGVLLTRASLNP